MNNYDEEIDISYPGYHQCTLNSDHLQYQTQDLLKISEENRQIGQECLEKLNEKIRKENLILSLRKDKLYYEKYLREKEESRDNLKNLLIETEHNKNDAISYCEAVKRSLKDFVAKVDDYERQIAKLKEERANIIRSSEAIIAKKRKEREELQRELDTVDEKIKVEQSKIDELNKKINDLNGIKEKEKKDYLVVQKEDQDKFNKLMTKYKGILNKFNAYEKDDAKKTKQKEDYHDRVSVMNNVNKEDLDIQLNEAKIKNELLEQEMEALTQKINKINQDKEEREKKFYMKPGPKKGKAGSVSGKGSNF